MNSDNNRLEPDACLAFFHALFPGGLQDRRLVEDLAPEGWERSPLFKVARPDRETVMEERRRYRENMNSLFGKHEPDTAAETEPDLDDHFENGESSINPTEECGWLLGAALWDIFSDNHEVVFPDGRLVDIGRFRGAAGFIADFYHCPAYRSKESREDLVERLAGGNYMEFYMGTAFVYRRADLTPVYEYIFRLLKRHACDWRYAFPQLHIVRFDHASEEDDAKHASPSESFARSEAQRAEDAEFEEMQRKLHEDAEQTRSQLLANPPKTVIAYREVFHRDPLDWNPT